ncbi:MAG: NmrA family NAD(P)-binding protein [Actinomycetota bacterium]
METLAITGAHGKTGRAVMAAVESNWSVRALARSNEQATALRSLGVGVVVGDIADRAALAALVDGATALYHICPNFHPDEVAIGDAVVDVAERVERLVYHSVLHPQTEAMPHHWRKLRVEEALLARRRGRVTFLRPAPYVQNLAPYLPTVFAEGVLRMPYSVDTPTAMVDLADVGRAAAAVLASGFDAGSGWDLCGVGAVSHREVAALLASTIGRSVEAEQVEPGPDTSAELGQMFAYMDAHGLPASPAQLRALVPDPTPFADSVHTLVDSWLTEHRGATGES